MDTENHKQLADFNRHFYCYEPPRPLEVIEGNIKTLEQEIMALLKEVTA